MSEQNGENESESIYRAPASETTCAPQGDLLGAYAGPKNADYYASQFDRFKTHDNLVSWNWPAFFFTSVWLLYRKMWLNAFFYWIVLPVALGFIQAGVAIAAGGYTSIVFYYSSYALISFVLLPMFANRMYYRHAQSKVNKVASVFSSPEQQSAELSRIGGTSNVILVVIPFVLIVLIGIFAAIAIPAYQDYTIRAQVSQGLSLSGGPKAAVTEHYLDTGTWAADNYSAGVSPADSISGSYVSGVEIVDGVIVITYGNQAHVVIQGKTVVLSPEERPPSAVDWTCSSPSIAPKHLPAACR